MARSRAHGGGEPRGVPAFAPALRPGGGAGRPLFRTVDAEPRAQPRNRHRHGSTSSWQGRTGTARECELRRKVPCTRDPNGHPEWARTGIHAQPPEHRLAGHEPSGRPSRARPHQRHRDGDVSAPGRHDGRCRRSLERPGLAAGDEKRGGQNEALEPEGTSRGARPADRVEKTVRRWKRPQETEADGRQLGRRQAAGAREPARRRDWARQRRQHRRGRLGPHRRPRNGADRSRCGGGAQPGPALELRHAGHRTSEDGCRGGGSAESKLREPDIGRQYTQRDPAQGGLCCGVSSKRYR